MEQTFIKYQQSRCLNPSMPTMNFERSPPKLAGRHGRRALANTALTFQYQQSYMESLRTFNAAITEVR